MLRRTTLSMRPVFRSPPAGEPAGTRPFSLHDSRSAESFHKGVMLDGYGMEGHLGDANARLKSLGAL